MSIRTRLGVNQTAEGLRPLRISDLIGEQNRRSWMSQTAALGQLNDAEDEFNRHFDLMGRAGERTRNILYLVALIFASFSIVVFEFNNMDWSRKRLIIISGAYFCHTALLTHAQTPPTNQRTSSNGTTSVQQSGGSTGGRTCGDYYDYINKLYKIPLGSTCSNPNLKDPEKKICNDAVLGALKDRYNQISKLDVEDRHVTIPIIGSRLDQGSITSFSNCILIMLYCLLFLSIKNEIQIIKAINKTTINMSKYRLIRNVHIFTRPMIWRRFRRAGRLLRYGFWWFLLIPPTFSIYASGSDLYSAEHRRRYEFILGQGGEVTDYRTFFALEVGSTILLTLVALGCIWVAGSLSTALARTAHLAIRATSMQSSESDYSSEDFT